MGVLTNHTYAIFLPTIFFLSAFGLGLGGIPQLPILLLGTLLMFAHTTQPRLRKRDPIAAVIAMTPGIAYSFYEPNPTESAPIANKATYFASLLSIGAALAVVSVLVVWVSVFISRRNQIIRKNPFIFPLLWSVSFFLMEKNPFGSWGDWSQTALTGEGFGTWAYVLSIGGLLGGNFVIAVISQGLASALQVWLDNMEEERYNEEESSLSRNARSTRRQGSNENGNILYAVILALLLSFWGTLVLKSPDTDSSPIHLGCVLATPDSTFETIMHDTKVLASQGAQLLLWSESAVRLDSDKALNEFFNKTLEEARQHNLYIGVTYSIPVPRTFKRQNVLSLLSPEGTILFNYSKSHPVPLAEYDVLPGPAQLILKEINLPVKDSKHPRKQKIPLNVSGAICHDIDFPNLISQAGKADIFLLPAQTWTAAAGWAHLGISRARSIEQGLNILRCDGGGISGFLNQNGQIRYFKDSHEGTRFMVDVSVRNKNGKSTWYNFLGNGGVFSLLIAILGVAGVGELENVRRLFGSGVLERFLGPLPGKIMGLLRRNRQDYEEL